MSTQRGIISFSELSRRAGVCRATVSKWIALAPASVAAPAPSWAPQGMRFVWADDAWVALFIQHHKARKNGP